MPLHTALLVALAIMTLAVPVRADTAGEQEIRNLEANFAEAVSTKNIDDIMRVYVPDQFLFVFDVVPPRQYVGADAYRKDWQEFLGYLNGPVKFTISDLTIAADGGVGYSHSIQSYGSTDPKGKPIDLKVRVTDIYQRPTAGG